MKSHYIFSVTSFLFLLLSYNFSTFSTENISSKAKPIDKSQDEYFEICPIEGSPLKTSPRPIKCEKNCGSPKQELINKQKEKISPKLSRP